MGLEATSENAKKSIEYLYREIVSGRLPNFRNNYALDKYIDYIVNTRGYRGDDGVIHDGAKTIRLRFIQGFMREGRLVGEIIPSEHFETVKTYFYRIKQNERYGFEHPLAQTYAMDVNESIDDVYVDNTDYEAYFFWVKNPN